MQGTASLKAILHPVRPVKIPVVIPTMPQRVDALRYTLGQLAGRAWVEPLVSKHVDSRQDVANAVRVANGSQPHWWIYLEDDVELSPRFDEIPGTLAHVDSNIPNVGAVSFFRLRDNLPTGLMVISARQLSSSLCVAFRGCDVNEFAKFAGQWYAEHPQHHHASDLLLGAWLVRQRQRLCAFTPSLVQHRRLPSTLGPRSRYRQSASYERVFGIPGL